MRDISRYLRPNKGGRGGGGRVATKAHVCNIKTIWNHTRNPQQEYNKVVAISRGEGMFNKGHPIYGAKKKKVSKILSDYKKEKETMAAAV